MIKEIRSTGIKQLNQWVHVHSSDVLMVLQCLWLCLLCCKGWSLESAVCSQSLITQTFVARKEHLVTIICLHMIGTYSSKNMFAS